MFIIIILILLQIELQFHSTDWPWVKEMGQAILNTVLFLVSTA